MALIDTETISEEQAIDAYNVLRARFSWAGTIFTRLDAQTEWQLQRYENDQDGSHLDMELSDDVWFRISSSYYWRKGLPDRLTEMGWELVAQAVTEGIQDSETSA